MTRSRIRVTGRAAGVLLAVAAAVSGCSGDPAPSTSGVAATVPADLAAGSAVPAGASPAGTVAGGSGSSSGSGSSGGSAGAAGNAGNAGNAGAVTGQRAVSLNGALTVRETSSASGKVIAELSAKTPMGSPRVLMVQQVIPGWVKVSLPTRPNGTSGWVPAASVRVEALHDQITIDLASRHLTVVIAGKQVASATVAVGSPTNPTPTGTFYVTDRVQPNDPHGAYGAFALGLSAHSPTLTEFGTGDGQIAVHGTNVPSSLGKAVSHGCIRVPTEVTSSLARIGLGTPVIIRP
ncbi:MAG TPA: L,D-transpeptidase [Kineosporiaceae bacterium]|nr:L,D-transpeptidase [Kineosporiaceae bacterium]